MKNLILLPLLLSLALALRADPIAASNIAVRAGGLVTVKGTPTGSILVVNAQKKVTPDNFDISKQTPTLARLATVTKVVDGAPATPATAAAMRAKAKADFALFIVDDKTLPPSLVAVEERWAIMNVAALEKGAKTPEVTRIRARNEFARVYAMLCGGFCSQYKAPLTNLVKDVSDLDDVLFTLPVDMGQRMYPYLAFCGVRPERRVPYAVACREGWAAAPTNEFQKAVWDKVHALPKKPIRIAPESKKVKE